MSVCDASLVGDALVARGALGSAASARLVADRFWHAPALLPCEVMSAIRGLWLGGHLDAGAAAGAQERLRRMRLSLHAFDPFHERVWELRANATAYDAWYVALAERLDAPLVTTDAKVAAIPGIRCTVEVVAGAVEGG